MCRAGPCPSFACISHSFAAPVTSPPHLRHFTKKSSPRLRLQSDVGHEEGTTFDDGTWVWWTLVEECKGTL